MKTFFLSLFLYFPLITINHNKLENCNYSYTDEEFKNLSKLLNAEGNQKDPIDMLYIGSTVLNRVDHPDFPNDIISVIKEDYQYDGYNTAQFKRTRLSDSIAIDLLNGNSRNYNVIYYFNYRMDAAPYFVKWLRRERKLIFKNNHHEFYK